MAVFRRGVGARTSALAGALVLASGLPVNAQKAGGTLRIYNTTQPPSASIHEEFDHRHQHAVHGDLQQSRPLRSRQSRATGLTASCPSWRSSWAWDASGTKLTFKLRSGVSWHDGKPFTGKDVQCTWHRLNGIEPEYSRRNPRKIWYENLKEVTPQRRL